MHVGGPKKFRDAWVLPLQMGAWLTPLIQATPPCVTVQNFVAAGQTVLVQVGRPKQFWRYWCPAPLG